MNVVQTEMHAGRMGTPIINATPADAACRTMSGLETEMHAGRMGMPIVNATPANSACRMLGLLGADERTLPATLELDGLLKRDCHQPWSKQRQVLCGKEEGGFGAGDQKLHTSTPVLRCSKG